MSAGSLGQARGEIVLDGRPAKQAIREVRDEAARLGTDTAKANDSAAKTAAKSAEQYRALGKTLTGVGGAAGIALGFAIKGAVGFEKQISAVGVATGATGKDLEQLRQKALQIGKDTSFSAVGGAQAIEELGKAGISTADIMAGAADAVVGLAAATGTELPQAAAITATALNQFQLSGNKAGDVANYLGRAAQKSQADVAGLGEGLKYVGTQAHGMNIPIEDSITALAVLNDNGLDASTAGTALNAALTSLINPSQIAADKMTELGISASNTDGTFKSLPDIIGNVRTATEGLTDAEKARTLNQIFGEQGGRAMLALLQNEEAGLTDTAKGWDGYKTAVTTGATTSEMAKQRLDNVAGAMDALRGSVETLGITVGSFFLPLLTNVIQGATAVVNGLLSLPAPIQAVGASIAALVGGLAGIGGAAILIGPKIKEGVDSLKLLKGVVFGLDGAPGIFSKMVGPIKAVGTAIKGLLLGNPILLAVAAAIALFALAYKFNFLGIRDLTDQFVGFLRDSLPSIGDLFRSVGGAIMAVLNPVISLFERFIHTIQLIQGGSSSAGKALDGLPGPLKGIASAIAAVIRPFRLFNDAMQAFASGDSDRFRKALHQLPEPLQKLTLLFTRVVNGVQKFANAWRKAGALAAFKTIPASLKDFGRTFGNLIESLTGSQRIGDIFAKVWEVIGQVIGRVAEAVSVAINVFKSFRATGADVFTSLQAAIRNFFGALMTGIPIVDNVIGLISRSFQRLVEVIQQVVNLVKAIFSGDWGAAWNALKAIATAIIDQVKDAFSVLGSTIRDVFNAIDWGAIGSAIKSGLSAAFDFIKDVATEAFDKLASAIGGINWGAIWDTITDIGGGLLDKLGDIVGGIKDWAVAQFTAVPWAEAWSAVKDAGAAIIGALGDQASKVLGWASQLLRSIPWAEIWSAIKDAGQYIVSTLGEQGARLLAWATTQIGSIPWSEIWGTVKDVGQYLISALGEQASRLLAWATTQIGSIPWGEIWGAIKDVGQYLAGALGEQAARLLTWATTQIGGIPWATVWATITDVGANLIGALGDQTDKVRAWAEGIIGGVSWDTIFEVVKTAIDGVGTAFTKVGGIIATAATGISTTAGTIGTVLSAIKGVVQEPINTIGRLVREAAKAVAEAATGIDTASSTIGRVLAAISKVASSPLNAVKAAVDLVRTTAETVASSVTTAAGTIGSMLSGIKDAVSGPLGEVVGFIQAIIDKAQAGIDILSLLPFIGGGSGNGGGASGSTGDTGAYTYTDENGPTFANNPATQPAAAPVTDPSASIASAVLIEQAQARIDAAVTAIGVSLTAMVATFNTTKIDVDAALEGIATALETFVTTAGEKATEAGEHYRNMFGSEWSTTEPDVQAHINNLVTILTTFVTTAGQQATDAGTHYRNMFGTEWSTTETDVQTHLDTLGTKMQTFTVRSGVEATLAGTLYRVNLATQLITANSGTQVSMNLLASKMQTFAGIAGSSGSSAGSSFRNGLASGLNSAVSAANSAAGNIRSALRIGDQSSVGYSIGASLGQGIANGIGATVSSIANAAANAVQAGINAAKTKAQTASPSKVMTQFGRDFFGGVPLGIDDTVPEVERSVSSGVAAAIAAAQSEQRRSVASAASATPSAAVAGDAMNMLSVSVKVDVPEGWKQVVKYTEGLSRARSLELGLTGT